MRISTLFRKASLKRRARENDKLSDHSSIFDEVPSTPETPTTPTFSDPKFRNSATLNSDREFVNEEITPRQPTGTSQNVFRSSSISRKKSITSLARRASTRLSRRNKTAPSTPDIEKSPNKSPTLQKENSNKRWSAIDLSSANFRNNDKHKLTNINTFSGILNGNFFPSSAVDTEAFLNHEYDTFPSFDHSDHPDHLNALSLRVFYYSKDTTKELDTMILCKEALSYNRLKQALILKVQETFPFLNLPDLQFWLSFRDPEISPVKLFGPKFHQAMGDGFASLSLDSLIMEYIHGRDIVYVKVFA